MTGSLRGIASAFTIAILSAAACERTPEKHNVGELDQAKRRGTTDTGTSPAPATPESGFECAVLVRGSAGDPFPSVHVDFLEEGGSLVAGKLTDARGIARFRVPAGKYNVRIANHQREVLAEVGYEIAGDTPTPIEVVLSR
jgi:hypothetical protein